MVDDVVEDEGPQHRALGHREQCLASVEERPHLAEPGVGRGGEHLASGGDVAVEGGQQCVRRRMDHGAIGGPSRRIHVQRVLLDRRRRPAHEFGDVARELAHRHRFRVRLPVELSLRHALEHAPRRLHFLIEFRQQCLSHRHGQPPTG